MHIPSVDIYYFKSFGGLLLVPTLPQPPCIEWSFFKQSNLSLHDSIMYCTPPTSFSSHWSPFIWFQACSVVPDYSLSVRLFTICWYQITHFLLRYQTIHKVPDYALGTRLCTCYQTIFTRYQTIIYKYLTIH